MTDFCYLVNPYFPTGQMKAEMKANFDTLLTEYPSGMYVNSLLAGKCFGVDGRHIVAGNGAAELIKSLMEHADGKTGGDRRFVPQMAMAAKAFGATGWFFEVHPDPDRGLSDAANMLELAKLSTLVKEIIA